MKTTTTVSGRDHSEYPMLVQYVGPSTSLYGAIILMSGTNNSYLAGTIVSTDEMTPTDKLYKFQLGYHSDCWNGTDGIMVPFNGSVLLEA